MKKDITKKRLLQLGHTLAAIISELEQSIDAPNPKIRQSKKAENRARVANKLDAHIANKRFKHLNKG